MGPNIPALDTVCCTIKALIIARKEWSTLEMLRADYREMEGCDIPYQSYGYSSLRAFLQSINQYITMEKINGVDYVFHVENEKSAHISKLVAEQKSTSKKPKNCRRGGSRYRPSRHFPVGGFSRSRLSHEELKSIINEIKHNPQGISKQTILNQIYDKNPYSHITMTDLENQLREISHEIILETHHVLPRNPVYANSQTTVTSFIPHQVTKQNAKSNVYNSKSNDQKQRNIIPAGYEEECDSADKDNDFFEGTHFEFSSNVNNSLNDHSDTKPKENIHNENIDIFENCLVSDRIKFRLEKLVQKHENGIWCAELPDLYLKEYNVTLNYTDLGFDSIRELAAYLKDVFVLEQPKERGDSKIHYAKTFQQMNGSNKKCTLASIYNIYDGDDREPALPEKLSQETCERFIPQDVLTFKETVGQINVLDLKDEEIVIICEIFDPSFFWIRQLKKMTSFNNMMKTLGEFYIEKYNSYLIPPVVLEKGLNIACKYNNIWHRGIVKSIRPDNFAYILFYDFGTVKLVPTKDLCFLHRKFSQLPALAVPCGMYNLQPAEDNRWSKWVVSEFVGMVLERPMNLKIKSIDEETNSAMVYLYNEQNYLHEWMIENSLAIESSVVSNQICNYLLQIDPYCLKKKLAATASEVDKNAQESISLRRRRAMLLRSKIIETPKMVETSESEVEGQSTNRPLRPNERICQLLKNRLKKAPTNISSNSPSISSKKLDINSTKNPNNILPTNPLVHSSKNLDANVSSINPSIENHSANPVSSKLQETEIFSSKKDTVKNNASIFGTFVPIKPDDRAITCPNELINLHTILGSNNTPIDWNKLLNNSENGENVKPDVPSDSIPVVQERSQITITRENLRNIAPNDYFSRMVKCDRFYALGKRNLCWSTKVNLKQFQSNGLPPVELAHNKRKNLPANTQLIITKKLIKDLKNVKINTPKPKISLERNSAPNEKTTDNSEANGSESINDNESASASSSCVSDSNLIKSNATENTLCDLSNKIEPKKQPLIVELSSHDFGPEEMEQNKQSIELDSSLLLKEKTNESAPINQNLNNSTRDYIKDVLNKLRNIANAVTPCQDIDSDDLSTQSNSNKTSISEISQISSQNHELVPVVKSKFDGEDDHYSTDDEYNIEYSSEKMSSKTSFIDFSDLDRWDVVGTREDFFGVSPFTVCNQNSDVPASNESSVVISEITETKNVNADDTALNSTLSSTRTMSDDSPGGSVSSNLETDSASDLSPQQWQNESAKNMIERSAKTIIVDNNWKPSGKSKSFLNMIKRMKRNVEVD